MSRLDQEPDVIGQARKLGLTGRGDPVQAVVGHCLDRIRHWVRTDGPVSTIGELEALVARRLHMTFEEVETDEALAALIRKYVKLGEGSSPTSSTTSTARRSEPLTAETRCRRTHRIAS